MKTYFVYILKCSDNSYYTGITNDLERRLAEHHEGLNKSAYTHHRRPVKLVFTTDFNDVNQAFVFEKQVKGWNRKKKEALIYEQWEMLPELAECKNETSHKNYKGLCFDSAQSDSKEKGFDSAQPDKKESRSA